MEPTNVSIPTYDLGPESFALISFIAMFITEKYGPRVSN